MVVINVSFRWDTFVAWVAVRVFVHLNGEVAHHRRRVSPSSTCIQTGATTGIDFAPAVATAATSTAATIATAASITVVVLHPVDICPRPSEQPLGEEPTPSSSPV